MSKTQVVINTVLAVVLAILMMEFYEFLRANVDFMNIVDEEFRRIHQKMIMLEKTRWN